MNFFVKSFVAVLLFGFQFAVQASADLGQTAAAAPTSLSAPPSSALPERIKAVVNRTLKHLVFLNGGTFDMGDWCGPKTICDDSRDSKPLHKVTLDGFSIMAHQVTYEEFDVFTEAVGTEQINMEERYAKQRGATKAASPNWFGAKAYCQWLGQQTNLPFDLPTEAQWEYAARSRGQRAIFATDTGVIERGRNFPPEWEYGAPKPPLPDVGSYPPNPAGLYGMSEGATEWVNDWYDPDYYGKSPQKNPKGPEAGTERVTRGSSGVPAEAANMVFMRWKETPRTTRIKIHLEGGFDTITVPGYSSLPGNAVRCVVNADDPKH